MLKLGEKIISDIYLGDKKIAKVFLGDKLVYQAGKPIFLDYVESDDNCYIDTDRPFYANNTYEFSYYTTSTENFAFLGCMNDVNGNVSTQGFDFLLNNDGFFYTRKGFIKGLVRVTVITDRTKVHSYKFCGTQSLALFDETNVWDSNLSSEYWQSDLNIILFKSNRGGTLSASKQVRILNYSVKDESGELVQDLRPCLDPNGVVCMYDMVTKKYFYNQGTGTLTAGNKIKFVDYIHTDGNGYIDTGIALGINHKVSVKTKVPSTSSTAIQLFGNYSDSAGYFTCNIANSIGAISRFDGATYTGNISRSDGNFHTYTLDKNGIIIDSDTILNWNKTPTDFQQSDSFYLFRARGSSSVVPNGTQISEEKVWENETLVQHLKPCVVAGQAGLYDMVAGKVFTNAGTGTLKASGRFVESIVFDGASYIDTGVVPVFGDEFEITATIDVSTQMPLFGAGTGTYQFVSVMQKNSMYYKYFETGGARFRSYTYEGLHTIKCYNDGSLTIDDNVIFDPIANLTPQTVDTSLLIGARGDLSRKYTGNTGASKLTASDGTVRFDLRPYVDENGTACFKDIVTGKLFYNQGTGKLEYTEWK